MSSITWGNVQQVLGTQSSHFQEITSLIEQASKCHLIFFSAYYSIGAFTFGLLSMGCIATGFLLNHYAPNALYCILVFGTLATGTGLGSIGFAIFAAREVYKYKQAKNTIEEDENRDRSLLNKYLLIGQDSMYRAQKEMAQIDASINAQFEHSN